MDLKSSMVKVKSPSLVVLRASMVPKSMRGIGKKISCMVMEPISSPQEPSLQVNGPKVSSMVKELCNSLMGLNMKACGMRTSCTGMEYTLMQIKSSGKAFSKMEAMNLSYRRNCKLIN
jgi:hypothetical protein